MDALPNIEEVMIMIKPIETRYKGYRFRSRLEARWAVLFDTLGVQYQYEVEGFELDDFNKTIRYLPDFLLLKDGRPHFWVEVKPYMPPLEDVHKLSLLCKDSDHNGLLLVGEPEMDALGLCVHSNELHMDVFTPSLQIFRHFELIWLLSGTAADPVTEEMRLTGNPAKYHAFIEDVFIAARSARFEFGEKGREGHS